MSEPHSPEPRNPRRDAWSPSASPAPSTAGRESVSPGRERRAAGASVFGGIRLGRVLGFEISLDYSWFIIAFLILASFTAFFSTQVPDIAQSAALAMGAAGTFLFFGSLLGHELAHAVVARWRGVEVEGITLFIFGGMARTRTDSPSARVEFEIAAAGPLASFLLAIGFWVLWWLGFQAGLGPAVTEVAQLMASLNLLLAVFNLFPGFPLDGGRILRAVVWHVTGDMLRATRVASTAGRMLGYGIMGLGILTLLTTGALVGGLWFIFIGWFLSHAARAGYQQIMLRDAMSTLLAREAMTPTPEAVQPDLDLDSLVNHYFLRRPYNSFPVAEERVPVGLVTLSQVKQVPREAWATTRTADIMHPLADTLVVDPDTPMHLVLERMNENGVTRVLVAREWQLEGIITGSDVANWLDRVGLLEARHQAARGDRPSGGARDEGT